MRAATKQPWTADELAWPSARWRYEIDDGALVIRATAIRLAHDKFGHPGVHLGSFAVGAGVTKRRSERLRLWTKAPTSVWYGAEAIRQGNNSGLVVVADGLLVAGAATEDAARAQLAETGRIAGLVVEQGQVP